MTVTFGPHDKPEMKPHEIAAVAGKLVIKHEQSLGIDDEHQRGGEDL
jgi:hypothetical protein